MKELCDLIRWIITYAVTGGFLHFVAVFLIVMALTKVTTLVALVFPTRSAPKPKKEAGDAD